VPQDLLTILSPTNIIIFVIIFTRISGMLFSMPLISTYPIPQQVKIWLCALVAFILFPMVATTTNLVVPHSIPELAKFLLREFSIGYLIGFCASFIFAAVQIGGEFVSIQIGISMSQVLDPATGEQTQVISQMYTYLATMVFIGINAHQWLFAAIYKSFETMPPGMEFLFGPELVSQILHLSSSIFSIGISMILPIFCVMFVAEVLMGFMSKMMPQMNIFMVAIPLKVYVGIVLILMFLSPTVTYLTTILQNYLKGILNLFG
jgi:flagellar biosynthetic protein FliR